jgi:hypothetical protein
MITIQLKRGDTFRRYASWDHQPPGGEPATWSVRSHVRDGARPVATLQVLDLDLVARTYTLFKAHDAAGDGTRTWPEGKLLCDIEYTFGTGADAVVESTDTFIIDVERDMTV